LGKDDGQSDFYWSFNKSVKSSPPTDSQIIEVDSCYLAGLMGTKVTVLKRWNTKPPSNATNYINGFDNTKMVLI
jgi:hypothetical protein